MAVSLFCLAQGKVQPWPFVPFLALFGATHLLLQLLSEPLAAPCPSLVLASLLCMVICNPHPFSLKLWLMKQVAVIIKSTCCSLLLDPPLLARCQCHFFLPLSPLWAQLPMPPLFQQSCHSFKGNE